MPTMSYGLFSISSMNAAQRGEIEQRAWRLEVGLDQHQSPRAMETYAARSLAARA